MRTTALATCIELLAQVERLQAALYLAARYAPDGERDGFERVARYAGRALAKAKGELPVAPEGFRRREPADPLNSLAAGGD